LYPYYSGIWKIFDIFFPPYCAGCGITGSRFCRSCFDSVALCSDPICKICGDQVKVGNNDQCDRCKNSTPYYSSIRSWGLYEGVLRKAIRSLKYKKDFGIGERLAAPLVGLLESQSWKIDLVTAVPLAHKRVRERGYNQSKCLAMPTAYYSGIKYSSKLILRIRSTRSQVGLPYSKRQTNVKNAFLSNPDLVAGMSVLLIDDVITTGATINACAESLISAGAITVYGISPARAARLLSE
jgi:ComF family protein